MTKRFETKRERLSRGRYHYAVYFAGEQVAADETRAQAEAKAMEILAGALRAQRNPVYASVTADGHVVTTREYAPGEVEFAHHREQDGRQGGSMISTLRLRDPQTYAERRVSVAEFHQHYLADYNAAAKG
jgi:hypothetical protein